MAQIGSRLIDATAGKITDDFFKAFEAQLQARAPADAAAASAVTAAPFTRARACGHARLGARRHRRRRHPLPHHPLTQESGPNGAGPPSWREGSEAGRSDPVSAAEEARQRFICCGRKVTICGKA